MLLNAESHGTLNIMKRRNLQNIECYETLSMAEHSIGNRVVGVNGITCEAMS